MNEDSMWSAGASLVLVAGVVMTVAVIWWEHRHPPE